MRVTPNSTIRQVVSAVQDRYELLAEAQRRISTGKALGQPSDDPIRAGGILALTSQSSRGEQYLRNVTSVIQELRTTEGAVGQVGDLMSRVRSLAVRASNGALNDSDREAIARQLDQELGELLRIANQRSGGRYLFGGGVGDNAPYVAERDDQGNVIVVNSPPGDAVEPMELAVGEGLHEAVSIPPDELFGLDDRRSLFTVIIALRDAVNVGDADGITGSVSGLDEAIQISSAATALIGARLASAQTTRQRLEDAKLESTQRLSDLADVDVVEAISRYNQEQTYYEMALRTAARIIQPSLLNFL